MKILATGNALWVPTGYGTQFKGLLPRLGKMGHQIALLAWYGLEGASITVTQDGIPIEVYPRADAQFGEDIIGYYAKHFEADVVLSLMDIWQLPADYNQRVGVPWMPWFPVDHEPLSELVKRQVQVADYPVTYSRFGYETAKEAGIDTTYIPHGIEPTVFKPLNDKAACRRALHIPEDMYLFLMVAANKGFPSRKNFQEAIPAFAMFCEAHPELDCRLYIHTDPARVYKGVNLPGLANEFNVADKMIWSNRLAMKAGIPDSQINIVYNAADQLLMPSLAEGFGLPLIEAQAVGLPVVTTNFSSMPELTKNGVLVNPVAKYYIEIQAWWGVPVRKDICAGMEEVYSWDDETKESKAEEGRKFVLRNYAWDYVANAYWKPFLERVDDELTGGGELEMVSLKDLAR